MDKQIAVITGASSGFGFMTSLELAKCGYFVIATMRNIEKSSQLLKRAEELGVYDLIHIHELDVTSQASINRWRDFMKTLGRIDVLINNAGFAGAGFVEEIPLDEYRKQFETNVFGVMAVTKAVLPIMREQKKGRIINISSISGRFGFPGLSPYISSKQALEGWSEALRFEMKPFRVDVVLVEPGSFQTSIWTSGKHVTKKSLDVMSPYYGMMKKLEEHIDKGADKFGDPSEVAKLIVKIAQKKQTRIRYMVGKGVKTAVFLKAILPWKVWEGIFLRQLK
ncbi:short-chain dehydrogenase [Bacillus sp. SA1-12]|uniref:oxidoreductase n=1 Tax=Bacillus sp. SA1-12 TaxID=1455638 RepID=UPI0006272449|nr:oxidoreductase [Bacillus sp. SA1-12]KKI89566.1 short-chain dehydrogenase [Bacillus sp. SA1-12]